MQRASAPKREAVCRLLAVVCGCEVSASRYVGLLEVGRDAAREHPPRLRRTVARKAKQRRQLVGSSKPATGNVLALAVKPLVCRQAVPSGQVVPYCQNNSPQPCDAASPLLGRAATSSPLWEWITELRAGVASCPCSARMRRPRGKSAQACVGRYENRLAVGRWSLDGGMALLKLKTASKFYEALDRGESWAVMMSLRNRFCMGSRPGRLPPGAGGAPGSWG
jgi:hypothetical protein